MATTLSRPRSVINHNMTPARGNYVISSPGVLDISKNLIRQFFELNRVFNTLRPRQNGRHFADDIFKYIFLNENAWISLKISLKFVPKGPVNNIPALVQIMAWRRPGDKPLSEPMMVSLLTHIYVTRPQWANISRNPYMTEMIKLMIYKIII